MKKFMITLIPLALVVSGLLALFPRSTQAQDPRGVCPPPSHSQMAVQGENLATILDNPQLYPGVTTYFAQGDAFQVAAAHANSWRLLAMYGFWGQEYVVQQTAIDHFVSMANQGYDMIIVDEPIHWLKNYLGYSDLNLAASKAAEVLNAATAAAKQINPNIHINVVEPYKAYLWAYLQAGGRPDSVAGEDYADTWGDVRLPDLDAMKAQYGVQTQQWVIGVNEILTYENKVDLIIAADVHGDWGDYFRVFKYADALKARLRESCQVFFPVVIEKP